MMIETEILLTILNIVVLFFAGLKMTHKVFSKHLTSKDITGIDPLSKLKENVNNLRELRNNIGMNSIAQSGTESKTPALVSSMEQIEKDQKELTDSLIRAILNINNMFESSETSLSADRRRAAIGVLLIICSAVIQIIIISIE